MNKYLIDSINFTDGYERIATITDCKNRTKIVVHFFEYGECLDCGEVSDKKKVGDIIEGTLSICLITFSKIVNDDITHYYPDILNSSWVNAVIEVTRSIDDYSLYAKSSITEEDILLEFETKVAYQTGDRLLINGSLEFEEKDETE